MKCPKTILHLPRKLHTIQDKDTDVDGFHTPCLCTEHFTVGDKVGFEIYFKVPRHVGRPPPPFVVVCCVDSWLVIGGNGTEILVEMELF